MDNDTMTIENQRREELLATRRQAEIERGSQEEVFTSEGPRGYAHRSEPSWLLAFIAAGMAWLAGLVIFVFPPLTMVFFIINFLTGAGIFMWAKSHNLKPPSFNFFGKRAFTGSFSAIATRSAKTAENLPMETVKGVELIPGSAFLYILLSGTTSPVLYLAALWWSNR